MSNSNLTVSRSCTLPCSARAVWALLGDFNGLYRWHPAVTDSQLEGAREKPGSIRTLTLADGAQLVEVLDSLDDASMCYHYRITEGPLPINNYRSEIRVESAAGDGCTVRWQSTFEADGVSEAEAKEVIDGIYAAGLDSLTALFR